MTEINIYLTYANYNLEVLCINYRLYTILKTLQSVSKIRSGVKFMN